MTPPTISSLRGRYRHREGAGRALAAQAPDGHWVGELEADSTITSEYLLLCHMLDRVDRDREAKMVKYLRERQLPDGGWSLYEGGPPNISATIKAYFAMKVAGVSVDDPAMEQARARIRDWGGPVEANVFTKILLALFGEYDWRGVPSMPVEIMLLPRWSYFNLLEVSYWSRTVIVPLLILMDSKPVKRLPDSCRLDELWPVPREQASLRLKRDPASLFPQALHLEEPLHRGGRCPQGLGAAGPAPVPRTRPRGGPALARGAAGRAGRTGRHLPAMTNAVLALRTLGYPEDHPLITGQIKEIENLGVETSGRAPLPALRLSGLGHLARRQRAHRVGASPDHPQLIRAGEWMMDKQITVPGDWQVKRPDVPPGGWPFQYHNDFYPDLDDSAMVMMALAKTQGLDADRRARCIERGLNWFLGMQGGDGGWGSFDADNDRLIFNNIPFADHGALLDPSTEDLTGRGLELLGTLGHGLEHPAAQRRSASSGGPSIRAGRGTDAGASTTSTARGRCSAGSGPSARTAPRTTCSVPSAWLEERQNADGGWGETLTSYEDEELAGRGESLPSQTAWALSRLFAAGRARRPRGGEGRALS